uniref:Uncharacterized protein n=1 Tax=Anguilla anguilla TaxID=7936 RepID=A0A0E9W679_ANGAN
MNRSSSSGVLLQAHWLKSVVWLPHTMKETILPLSLVFGWLLLKQYGLLHIHSVFWRCS